MTTVFSNMHLEYLYYELLQQLTTKYTKQHNIKHQQESIIPKYLKKTLLQKKTHLPKSGKVAASFHRLKEPSNANFYPLNEYQTATLLRLHDLIGFTKINTNFYFFMMNKLMDLNVCHHCKERAVIEHLAINVHEMLRPAFMIKYFNTVHLKPATQNNRKDSEDATQIVSSQCPTCGRKGTT